MSESDFETVNKYVVAQILRDLGILIELVDPYPQKGFAYRKAARAVESIPNLDECVKNQTLENYPGIGQKIAWMISSLVYKGFLPYYEELKQKIPSSFFELLNIPGLNAKKVRMLYEKLGISTFDDLQKALQEDSIQTLRLFSPAGLLKLRRNIELIKAEGHTSLFPRAYSLAQSLIFTLENAPVNEIVISGQLRRKCEVISQLNLVAVSERPDECLKALSLHPMIESAELKKKHIEVRFKNGLQAYIAISNPQDYIWTLFVDTGSTEHVDTMLQEAESLGIPISKLQKVKRESQIYKSLGFTYIPPELRENQGEIQLARHGKLPHLIELEDLKGIFHCHTIDSDGRNTLEQMADKAHDLGWSYIGISDHSKSSAQVNGLNEERLFLQIEKIHQINKSYSNFYIFSGIECDILKNGDLDFSNEVLKALDFVIVSVHRFFKMEKNEMTKRIIKAIEKPYTTILGHVSGRLLRSRAAYEIDIDKIIDACIANGVVMELNATPDRLDMDWRYWIRAKNKGLLCSINPDAHSLADFQNCQYGINMARKGWLEKKEVINTMPLNQMKKWLKNRKK